MSQENVETVMSTFRAFQEHDDAALFANYAPGIEWDMRGYSPWTDRELFRGHDGVREFFRLWLEDFTGYQFEALDPVEAGERVVVTVVDRAEGKRSGARIERVHGQVWTVHDGLVIRVQVLDSRDEALKAVGLEE